MGCDIHLAIEKRGDDGEWVRAERMAPPWWVKAGVGDETELVRESWYHGRNYSLFAMLADVRNGSGFAGTDLGDPVVPIAHPRGVPEDVSAETQNEIEEWGVDGHSHSWFTLEELLAVDWSGQTITHRAWVRKKRALLPHPDGQDDDTFAKRWEDVANSMGDVPSAEGWGYETCGWSSEGQGSSGWRTVQWTVPWYRAAGEEWMACILRMAREAPGKQKWIRIVFWFDN